jgi:hypothetical protein
LANAAFTVILVSFTSFATPLVFKRMMVEEKMNMPSGSTKQYRPIPITIVQVIAWDWSMVE